MWKKHLALHSLKKILEIIREGAWVRSCNPYRISWILILAYFCVGAIYIGLSSGLVDPLGRPIGSDFLSFYAASKLILTGEPALAYNLTIHRAVEAGVIGNATGPYYAWFYPPFFLCWVWWLSLFHYLVALFLWLTVSILFYAWPISRLAGDFRAKVIGLASPAVFLTVLHGQTSFLVTGILATAFLLNGTKPRLMGMLLGLLCFKPQFLPIIPLFLLFERRWITLIYMLLGIIALAIVTTTIFGSLPWIDFWHSAQVARSVALEQGGVGFEKLQSGFAAIRLLGGSVTVGYSVQVGIMVLGMSLVIWVWRKSDNYLLHVAALIPGILLSTPFFLDYDLLLLAIPVACIFHDAKKGGFLNWEISSLGLIWVWPGLARMSSSAGLPLTPVFLFILLSLIVRRVVLIEGKEGW